VADEHANNLRGGGAGGVVSLFSGALGLDLGLEAAGFELRVAVESNRAAVRTIRANRPELALLDQRVETYSTAAILDAARLSTHEPVLVSAGPSCQAFSTAGRRRSLDDDRGTLFREFLRVVREAQPRFFVMENVRGILSAAVRHRPLRERGPGHPPLHADEQHGSAFRLILRELRLLGYYTVFGLVDAADFGAAQHRHRLMFLGSRDGENLRFPPPTHGPPGGALPPYRTLADALEALDDPEPVCLPLPPEWLPFLEKIKAGGNWRDLAREEQEQALGAAYHSWGGRSGFFRRLAWDRPTPALTTRPTSKATMLIHPTELRSLSVAEYARVQGFPDRWRFLGGAQPAFTQIGNAVPREIGKAVGRELMRLVLTPTATLDPARRGRVACADPHLIERYNRRPRTVLNPRRMRQDASGAAAREWLATLGGATREPVDVDLMEPDPSPALPPDRRASV